MADLRVKDNLQYLRPLSLLQHIVFFEEGEPLIDGEPGDLKFVVSTQPHSRFVRQGNDLWRNVTVSLEDALIGFATEVASSPAAPATFQSWTPHLFCECQRSSVD